MNIISAFAARRLADLTQNWSIVGRRVRDDWYFTLPREEVKEFRRTVATGRILTARGRGEDHVVRLLARVAGA